MTAPFILPPVASDAAAIGVGAVCGALSRYHIGKAATERISKNPKKLGHLTGWHTAGINILGSLLLGGIFASPVVAEGPPPASPASTAVKAAASKAVAPTAGLTPRMKLMLGVGFCGSFTTFSTYSVDVANMLNKGQAATALKYVMANNLGCVTAAAVGMTVAKKFFGR